MENHPKKDLNAVKQVKEIQFYQIKANQRFAEKTKPQDNPTKKQASLI